jgi:biopolymer transport protein ExbD
MTWLNASNLARTKNSMWIAALLVLVSTMTAAPRSTAQAIQRGVSVQLVPTSSAVPVPDADNSDALIVTVTDTGKLYLGVDPVAADSLWEKLKGHVSSHMQNLYIKSDARAPYASVVKVVDAAHSARVASVTLLTTQTKTTAGTVELPEGIEMELARRSPAAADEK